MTIARTFDYDKAGQLYREGMHVNEIAKYLGVSVHSIRKAIVVLRAGGVETGNRSETTRQAKYGQAIEMLKSGVSAAFVAETLGLNAANILHARKLSGTYQDGRQRDERSPRRKAARILKQAGMTYEEIGQALGISRQRAQQLVRPTPRVMEELRSKKGNACANCGATDVKLDLHHSKYDSGPDALLCVPCHKTADKQVRFSQYAETIGPAPRREKA